jgi:tRNA (5-methylaminomethyl-2-thiouridylate)-methyltransferase
MKIAVLVSGGVDSSVALALLKEQGHDVTAFYLKIWLEDELSYLADCPWQEDLSYVRQVCEQLDVPLEVLSLQQEYRDEVVGYTIREVKAGRTPNPDILCNKRIKFGLFLDKIDSRFEKVATGHYAQIEGRTGGGVALKMAPDPIKDQTYFLSHLSQAQLARAVFPIGHLQKFQVRELAHRFNLPNKDRKDSQGICFLGKFKYRDFIKHYLGEMPGDLIEHETGEKLGRHEGFWFYTVGQRQGIRLSGGPWYVVGKDCEKNVVYISREYYSADKARNVFEIDTINLISHANIEGNLHIKMRHGPELKECIVEKLGDGIMKVILAEDDQGIAPGQYAVFYAGDICIGSGIIRQS